MSEHSAKRQRLDSTGRFSPASPSFDDVEAARSRPKTSIHPRTPTSPPYPSMNSQANGGPATHTTAASADKSPPSSVTMSQSHSHAATSAYPIPTPASTTGVFSGANVDSDGDAMMDDGADDDGIRLVGDFRPSNHNRQPRLEFSEKGGMKAAEGVTGSQLYRVAGAPCVMSKPHGSQNLFKLYGLEPLARSVARTDPITGEKINKLRKSYEGHIKQMQISGKHKAVKMDAIFSGPALIPEQEWWQLSVHGKEMDKAFNPERTALDAGFDSLLDSAFAGMDKGPLPPSEAARFRTYIGVDDTAKPKPQDAPSHRAAAPTSAAPTPGVASTNRGIVRPERAGAKRQYTDTSFQGYGEGYGDDFAADSTGGEDNTPGGAKRRKFIEQRSSHSVEVGGVRR